VVGVRFKKAGKIYYFDPGELVLAVGANVIVETARGLEYGEIVIGPREVADEDIVAPLKTVQRKATFQDGEKMKENTAKEKEAFAICEQKIAAHGLDMNLVDVEYTFDVNKIIFYFTAEGRIDFRELVKDLAAVFRTRIELRQIGVRDEAKMMGGIGCCGRPLCCATFLGDFEPVSIRMAKDQNLSLNPTKISGICGRLMCCLKYESDCYGSCCKKAVPPVVGADVVTTEGEGRVTAVNQNKKTATVLLQDGKAIVIPWEDVVEKDEK
jgi:cell fate regulator YaaT (PSP1 superfamily)